MKLSANAKTFVAAKVTDAFAKELKENQDEADTVKAAYKERFEKFEKKVNDLVKNANVQIEKVFKAEGFKLRKGCDMPQATIRLDRDQIVDTCTYVYSESSTPDNGYFRAKAKVDEISKRIKDAISKALYEIEIHGKKDTLEDIINTVIADARKNGKVTVKKENK